MKETRKRVNQWIKRHNILSKNDYIKFYYRMGNKKYTVRKYTDLARYSSGSKYLELDCVDLNSNTNKEIIELKDAEILKLKPLGEIRQTKGEDFYIIEWSKDDIDNNGKVGNLLENKLI